MENQIQVTTNQQTLDIIAKALELYTRISLGQFDHIKNVTTIQKELMLNDEDGFKKDLFESYIKSLEGVFSGIQKPFKGIFHEEVADDAKVAADLHHTIKRYKILQEGNIHPYSIYNVPSDICKIAEIEEPLFNITNK